MLRVVRYTLTTACVCVCLRLQVWQAVRAVDQEQVRSGVGHHDGARRRVGVVVGEAGNAHSASYGLKTRRYCLMSFRFVAYCDLATRVCVMCICPPARRPTGCEAVLLGTTGGKVQRHRV